MKRPPPNYPPCAVWPDTVVQLEAIIPPVYPMPPGMKDGGYVTIVGHDVGYYKVRDGRGQIHQVNAILIMDIHKHLERQENALLR